MGTSAIFFLYNFMWTLGLIFIFPYVVLRSLFDRTGVLERVGRYGWPPITTEARRPLIWLHAASVGEVKALGQFTLLLQRHFPQAQFCLSTFTRQGKIEARKILPNVSTFYLPLDHPWPVRRAVAHLKPALLILAETELWPNLIIKAHQAGAHVFLVNGRISASSFPRYRRFRRLFAPALTAMERCWVQSDIDRARLVSLGAPAERVEVVGSLKFDHQIKAGLPRLRQEVRNRLHLAPDRPVVVAGSTRPGEEELVIEAFASLRQKFPQALLIIAPRHLKRLGAVEILLQQKQLAAQRLGVYRQNGSGAEDLSVLVVDSMGELALLYAAGDVAFVGGSLVDYGGHNPLEPAVVGTPVVFGPFTDHAQRAAEILLASGLGTEVRSVAELVLAIEKQLLSRAQPPDGFARFQTLLERESGTAALCVEKLRPYLS